MLDFFITLRYHPGMIDENFLELYVLMCRTVTKPVRLKIIDRIAERKVNVSDLQKELGVPLSNLSNHLNDLYRVGVLGREKQGNYVYYFLSEPRLIGGIAQMQEIFRAISAKRNSSGG